VGTTARLAGSTSCTNCTRGLTTTRTAATICNGKQMSGTGLENAHSIQNVRNAAETLGLSAAAVNLQLCMQPLQLDVTVTW
jgi:hypothetical protein